MLTRAVPSRVGQPWLDSTVMMGCGDLLFPASRRKIRPNDKAVNYCCWIARASAETSGSRFYIQVGPIVCQSRRDGRFRPRPLRCETHTGLHKTATKGDG